MQWTKHSAIMTKTFRHGGFFHDHSSGSIQALIHKAFLPPAPVMKKTVDPKTGKETRVAGHSYAMEQVKIKREVRELLEYFASLIGAEFTQVVHVLVTDRPDKLAASLLKRLENSHLHIKTKLPDGSQEVEVRWDNGKLGPIHMWQQTHPEKVNLDDCVKAVERKWAFIAGGQTDEQKKKDALKAAARQRDQSQTEAQSNAALADKRTKTGAYVS